MKAQALLPSFVVGLLASLVACSDGAPVTEGSASSETTSASKHVVVSLRDQRARAFEGDVCVREFPISTGKVYAGGNFDTTLHDGERVYDFAILGKERVTRMRSPFPGISYDSEVFNAVRLSDWGIYLHEANWTRTGPAEDQVTGGDCGHCGNTSYVPYGFSHGCVNERHDDAVWYFDWAPAPGPEKVVHLTEEAFTPATCAHVSKAAAEASAVPPSPEYAAAAPIDELSRNHGEHQVAGMSFEACLAHPTHCREDLRDSAGVVTRFICWESGGTSTTGHYCSSGQFL